MDGDAQADYTLKIKFDYIDMGNVGADLWAMSRKAVGGFDLKNPNFGRRMALFHKSLAREFLDFAKKQSKK